MPMYKIAVQETVTYDVCVEAKNAAEAEEKALECYGYKGEVGYWNAEIFEMEEVK